MSTASADLKPQHLEIDVKGVIQQIQKFKSENFSGEFIVNSLDGQTYFSLVFRLGRIIWLSSSMDPAGYWKRHLLAYNSSLPLDWIKTVANYKTPLQSSTHLADLMIEGTLGRQDLTNVVIAIAGEVLFDLVQASRLTQDRFIATFTSYESTETEDEEESRSIVFLPLIEVEPVLKTAIIAWQEWQATFNTTFSPNLFPVIQKPDLITSLPPDSDEFRILSTIDGAKTIRDLAQENNYPVIELSKSILFFLKSGSLALSRSAVRSRSIQDATPKIIKKGITVACVDDSPLVYQTLSQILAAHGYDCYGVQEPLRIMPTLIKNKPDFIFLDLLMPIINGYEVCAQIRKTPSLKDIPVVILTGKDGLVDRMRSKMVGSTDFLSKPVSAETVLKILEKHLTVRSK
jgi:two-component system, chemotaxis family, response regulator PixG